MPEHDPKVHPVDCPARPEGYVTDENGPGWGYLAPTCDTYEHYHSEGVK